MADQADGPPETFSPPFEQPHMGSGLVEPPPPRQPGQTMPIPSPHSGGPRRMVAASQGSLPRRSPMNSAGSGSVPKGDVSKSPSMQVGIYGRVVLTRQHSSPNISPRGSPRALTPSLISETPPPVESPPDAPSVPSVDKLEGGSGTGMMLMSRSHPQFHRKAYYEAGVRFVHENEEDSEAAGAMDHLLQQPLDEEGMIDIDEAILHQVEWLDHFFRHGEEKGKGGGSLSIIFTIWSTMCGSTMLSLPWAFNQAGLLMSLVVFTIGFVTSTYTCHMIYKQASSQGYNDYFRLIRRMSPKMEIVATWTSTLVLIVALMSYHVYATQCFLGMMSPKHQTAGARRNIAFLIAGGEWVVSFIRNLDPLFKLTTVAILFVVFNMLFIIVKSVIAMRNGTKCGPNPPDNLTMYSDTWPQLATMLCLSFFIHNLITPILASSNNPDKRGRDMLLGYVGTAGCYAIPALISMVAFRHCTITQNFLDMFPYDDYYALIARGALVLQILMVYPLIVFLCRSQVFNFFKGKDFCAQTVSRTAPVSFLLIGIASIPAALNVGVGDIASIGGGICGLVWIYILPIAIHFWLQKAEGNRVSLLDTLVNGTVMVYGIVTVILLFKQTFQNI